VGARSGNISRAFREHLFITRTGSCLGDLSPPDIVKLHLYEKSPLDERASVELDVHRAVVIGACKRAVVHAHPPAAVALSLSAERIELPDYEGRAVLGDVPLLDAGSLSRSEAVREIADLLRYTGIVLIKGHGVFSAADELAQAYNYVSALEHSCRLILLSYTKGCL